MILGYVQLFYKRWQIGKKKYTWSDGITGITLINNKNLYSTQKKIGTIPGDCAYNMRVYILFYTQSPAAIRYNCFVKILIINCAGDKKVNQKTFCKAVQRDAYCQ